jgi:pilus assembly protein TadC
VATALLAATAAVLLGAAYAALPVAILAGFAVRILYRSGASAGPDPRSVALVLDLLAATLAAGAPPEHAIAEVAVAVEAHGTAGMRAAAAPLQLVGRLLRLGSDPATAWSGLDSVDGLAQVGLAGRRCAHSGARLANALADTAGDLRAEHQAASISRAQRTGVWTLLPLGCCFLPAFICLGVLPVVLGVAGQVLGNG